MEHHPVPVPGIRELLERTWDIARPNLKKILALTFLVHLPKNILLAFHQIPEDNYWPALYREYKINRAFDFWIGILLTLWLIHYTTDAFKGTKLSASELYRRALGNYLRAIGATFLYGLALVFGVLLLIIPGIVAAVYLMFFLQAIVIYNTPATDSLNYSCRHVKGRWWAFFGRSLALYAFLLGVGLFISVLYHFLPDTFIIDLLFEYPADILKSFFTIALTTMFLMSENLKDSDGA